MIDDNFWQFTRELADETCDALKSIGEVNKIQLVISLTYKKKGGELLIHFSKTIELIISFHGGWCQLSFSVSKRDKRQICLKHLVNRIEISTFLTAQKKEEKKKKAYDLLNFQIHYQSVFGTREINVRYVNMWSVELIWEAVWIVPKRLLLFLWT